MKKRGFQSYGKAWCFGEKQTIDAPQLEETVIGSGDDKRLIRMERDPIDASVMSIKRELDDNIAHTEQITSESRIKDRRATSVSGANTRLLCLFAESRHVPDADSLVKRARNNEILGGVELGAHDVVSVASQDSDALTALPVPDANCLIIRSRQDPRHVSRMELHCADVIGVAVEVEQASALLVAPHFDLAIIATTHKKRLNRME